LRKEAIGKVSAARKRAYRQARARQ